MEINKYNNRIQFLFFIIWIFFILRVVKIIHFQSTIAKFSFNDFYCTVPSALVLAYALGIAASGNASRILLAGFDGYNADDPRTFEVDKLFNIFQKTNNVPPLISITKTCYKIESNSVYSML